jgi:hypothetical protein
MGKVRTVIVSVLLAGAGIALAAWAPVTDLGYTGASSGLLGGALVGAALALLVSEAGLVAGAPLALTGPSSPLLQSSGRHRRRASSKATRRPSWSRGHRPVLALDLTPVADPRPERLAPSPGALLLTLLEGTRGSLDVEARRRRDDAETEPPQPLLGSACGRARQPRLANAGVERRRGDTGGSL